MEKRRKKSTNQTSIYDEMDKEEFFGECNMSMTCRRALKCTLHSAASLIIHTTSSLDILCDFY